MIEGKVVKYRGSLGVIRGLVFGGFAVMLLGSQRQVIADESELSLA
jgi:hypothetical protein